MVYDPTGARGIVPVSLIKPIVAADIGDATAGGSAQLQTYIDARRNWRGKVATIAARNSLPSPLNGDTVLVEDNGSGLFQIDAYKLGTTSWITMAVEGGAIATISTYKAPVRFATTVNLAATRTGAVLTASANGVMAAVDGITPVVGMRALVKNQTTGADNGVYDVTSIGAAGAPFVLTRSADADVSGEVLPSTVVIVEEGTTQLETAWILSTNSAITLNTTTLTFVRFAADALTLTGQSRATTATIDTVMGRDATGRTQLVNHASLGTAAAAAYAIAADAGGLVPAAAERNPSSKAPVRLATAAALPANTRSANVLTATANGALTVDSVAVAVSDRVLVKNEVTGANNGIFDVTAAGGAGAPFVLTRSIGADTSAEVTACMSALVAEGTVNADTFWFLSINAPITLNTTALSFIQLAGGGAAGSVTVTATVTTAKALTGLVAGSLVLIQDLGLFRFIATQPDTPDDETIINVTAGGQLIIEAAHPDAIFAWVEDQIAAVGERVDAQQIQINTVVPPGGQFSFDLAMSLTGGGF